MGDDVVRISIVSSGGTEGEGQSSAASEELYGKAMALADGQSYATGSSVDEDGLLVNVRDGDASAPALLKLLIENDMDVVQGRPRNGQPGDVFLKHTRRTIRQDNAHGDAYDQTFRQMMGVGRRR